MFCARYVTGPGSGYLPGAELKIPLPMSDSVLGWSVKITWDLPTVQNNIQAEFSTPMARSVPRAELGALEHAIKNQRGASKIP